MEYLIEFDKGKWFIKEADGPYKKIDLEDRLLKFSVNSLKFLMSLPQNKEFNVFKYQFSKSSTSIGANFEEAQSSTYREFIQRMRTALREANESVYWLKILNELKVGDDQSRIDLLNEAIEISKILGSIVSKAHKNLRHQDSD